MIRFLKDEFYSSVASISSGVFNKNLRRKAVVAFSEKK